MDPVYMDKDGEVIKKLMSAYKEVTGDETQPQVMGGGTYARSMDNIVAFGPVFPDQEELAHEANECYSVAGYRRITEMYAEALQRLSAMIGD